jgi:hypothetical protein
VSDREEVAVKDVRTVQLGQFTDDNAERIAAALEQAGIAWWHKAAGRFVRFLSAADWGTRIYVDAAKLEERERLARELHDSVAHHVTAIAPNQPNGKSRVPITCSRLRNAGLFHSFPTPCSQPITGISDPTPSQKAVLLTSSASAASSTCSVCPTISDRSSLSSCCS